MCGHNELVAIDTGTFFFQLIFQMLLLSLNEPVLQKLCRGDERSYLRSDNSQTKFYAHT